MSEPVAAVVVLAAGEGTRMKSRTPKVLHEIGGRTLLGHIIGASEALEPGRLLVVVGHGRDQVVDHLALVAPGAVPVVQERQEGTGHAVRLALEALVRDGGEESLAGTVVVCPGDAPLLTGSSLLALARRRAEAGAAAAVLTAVVPDPTGYGRVLRGADGGVRAVVEHADATDTERAVTEINTSVYAFDGERLRSALAGVGRDNAQGEEYLPDVVGALVAGGEPVVAVTLDDWREGEGVNDRVQLAAAGRRLRDRVLEAWMRAGVTVIDPATTWVDTGVELEADAVLLPNTHLRGATRVAAGARVGPNVVLSDTTVAAGAQVADATCDGARIGEGAQVGPYTYLRPGTVLARGTKAGGFVEIKNSVIGEDSKVPHLSYVGDATVGERTNVGAATVFVNFDGVDKHRTVVGDDVRIGSDTMLVAPVSVGDGAYTAAGSVVTDDVPPGALAVGRARQRNVEGWVARKRGGTPAARAAQAALEARPEDQR